MIIQSTNKLRIKRRYEYTGRGRRRITRDTMQQWWRATDSFEGKWVDVPIVETDCDEES